MKRLAIYGVGGMAREVLELVRDINAFEPEFEVIGWLDDDASKAGMTIKGLPVLGPIERVSSETPPFESVIAIGNPVTRMRIAARLDDHRVSSPVLIDPRAHVGRDVVIGAGSIVCAGAIVTTDVRLGRHVILNVNATVSHDSALSDYVTLAPGVHVAGSVRIAEGCDIGTGCATVQGVSIGEWSIVGAGAVVARDLPANVTAVGVPAKVIKERPAGWQLEV